MIQHVPTAEGQIVVCQCHRSCRNVEVEQLVRYFPQVHFLDKVVVARCCTTTGACGWTEQNTVEVPQLQCSDKGTMSLLCRSSSGSRGRCLKFSSSPEFVDLSICNETVGFQLGFGGDVGAGIFRAPPGCPGVERQFSEPSMTNLIVQLCC